MVFSLHIQYSKITAPPPTLSWHAPQAWNILNFPWDDGSPFFSNTRDARLGLRDCFENHKAKNCIKHPNTTGLLPCLREFTYTQTRAVGVNAQAKKDSNTHKKHRQGLVHALCLEVLLVKKNIKFKFYKQSFTHTLSLNTHRIQENVCYALRNKI